jgi:hypothetical protein
LTTASKTVTSNGFEKSSKASEPGNEEDADDMPERENELFCYFSSSFCSFLRTNPLFEPPNVKLLL